MSNRRTSLEMPQKKLFGRHVSQFNSILFRARLIPCTAIDNPDQFIDAPVSLQLICQKLEEEKTLRLVGVALDALKLARGTAL